MFWRVFILVVLGLINVVLFCRMVWGPTGLVEYRELKQQYAALQEQIAVLDAENLALSREIRLLQSDKQYVEKMIRQRLHYVRDNEVLYLFGSSAKTGAGATNND
ncbi:FtsB family cell division protein [Desulfovibrio sp. SGI.169]|uniref:FtsB family cell division protein n=1 Tax=Desulfovibrio sp. SGI.169 TaxID=3420561 RepID=UPI003D06B160